MERIEEIKKEGMRENVVGAVKEKRIAKVTE